MSGTRHPPSLLPDFVLYPLGVMGGILGYYLDRRHVKIGMTNLSIAFPDRSEEERRRILRVSYINLGKGAAEYVRLGGIFSHPAKRPRRLRSLRLLEGSRAKIPR